MMKTKNSNSNTTHITLRVPQHVVDRLENEANRLNITASQLHNSILQKWSEWDSYKQDLGLVSAPKEILTDIMSHMGEEEILKIVSKSMRIFKDAVIMMEGQYDLKRCIVVLEKYMRSTGMVSRHVRKRGMHYFTIKHEMGISGSMFIEVMLRHIFEEFVPGQEMVFEISEGATVAKIDLGSDWDEHDI